ncbi:Imm1 family immunity protein [Roseiconus lacunae]|uniref:Imm1 family immunity protein n=1 Tax=Roseiconus lacunae TaxID=2605694 RepID=UPI001E3A6E34|nr:Imm1 family immunity protein [Roseiconus lacunae]MCD0462421.1 hypothetical protein [Roseiconus lacunae]
MFVQYLFVDDLKAPPPSVDPDFGIIVQPEKTEVENAIRSLDGASIRMIILGQRNPKEDSHFPFDGRGMIIGGGGPDGLYCCMVGMEDETTVHYLIDASVSNDDDVEIMRGQIIDMPRSHCVGIDVVLKAAIQFAETGESSDQLTWESAENEI